MTDLHRRLLKPSGDRRGGYLAVSLVGFGGELVQAAFDGFYRDAQVSPNAAVLSV